MQGKKVLSLPVLSLANACGIALRRFIGFETGTRGSDFCSQLVKQKLRRCERKAALV
ncbi:hypothetical protein HMPREF1981_00489 [Bacteroides pyogenes F0041]|uniref:Uncharacterized protein n=1 Tax=Bacteroides pyogenes F0041 TaxID=1321819 RepID=U2E7U2_9BACE|nr:hypothetical protein HMPREF1981_00489 [Bacteroides pyogenes F0041]